MHSHQNQNKQLLDDLNYASQIAKDGVNTPLLGGQIGLMWGVLLTVILGYQYVVLSGAVFGGLTIAASTLGPAWVTYALIGAAGSFYLGRKIEHLPGVNSVNNRLCNAVWSIFGLTLIMLAIGIILHMIFAQGGTKTWNMMLVFAFAAQGMAYAIVGSMAKEKILYLAAFISYIISIITLIWIDDAVIYLIGSLGAIVTLIIPNVIMAQKAKAESLSYESTKHG